MNKCPIKTIPHDSGMSGYYIVYRKSASREEPGERGLTHLVEHLGCTLVKKLEQDMDRYGISWNAMTDEDVMCFYMLGLTDSVSAMIRPFTEAVTGFRFTQKDFDREKKVVLQEYEDAFSKQTASHYYNLLRRKFGYCSAIGYRKDIQNATRKQVLEIAQMVRTPDEIIAVGFPIPLLTDVNGNSKPLSSQRPAKTGLIPEPIARVENDSVIMMSDPISPSDVPNAKFLAFVLDHGFQSPLNKLLREKHGLVYYASADCGTIFGEGVFCVATETVKKNSRQVADIISQILSNPKKYITDKRVEEIRGYLRVRRKIAEIKMPEAVEILLYPDSNSFSAVETVTTEQLHKLCSQIAKEPSIDRKDFK